MLNFENALAFATIMHKGQYRKDGSEYINHPIRVANYVAKYKKSSNLELLVNCSYLHDTIEDTKTTYYDLVNKFGVLTASIVQELTTDIDFKKELGKSRYLQIKMKNMTSWALVIKLCDRLDNISDSITADQNFRNRYVAETLEIINFLINNRDLSKTHLLIIKQILIKIQLIKQTFNQDTKEVNHLFKLVL